MRIQFFIFILSFVLFLSCGKNIIEKPKNMLSESQMEALMYDLAILESAKNTDYQLFDSINFDAKESIYSKYNMDSISLSENMIYYTSLPKKYNEIITNVEKRIKKERDSLEQNRQNEKSPEPINELLEIAN